MSDLDDNSVIQQIAAGDSQAVALLYDRYGRLAYGLAYRIVGEGTGAEEVVQDAFMQVWKRANTFDPAKGAGVRSWLLTIVHNRAIDLLRRRSKQSGREMELLPDAPYEGDPDPMHEVIAAIDGDQVREAMLALSDDQRIALELAYFHDLTQREIAEKLGIPLGTVKSRIRLGLNRLYELMDRQSALGQRA